MIELNWTQLFIEKFLSKLWTKFCSSKNFSLILSSPKLCSLWRKSESFTIRSSCTHFHTKIMAYRIIVLTAKKVSSQCKEDVYRFGEGVCQVMYCYFLNGYLLSNPTPFTLQHEYCLNQFYLLIFPSITYIYLLHLFFTLKP